jgi:protein phosphatase 1 regulatory subunit 7
MIRIRCLFLLMGYALSTSLPVIASNTVLPIKIADKALSECIAAQANKYDWKVVEDVHTLKCHSMDIRSIEGLNTLTQLKSLSLYNNKLENLDLREFSQLEHLNIANNKLRTISLVNLSHLHTLYLFKNKLVTVDFTGLQKLSKIRITNNQLSSLDISPLISLEKAYFFDNKLEELIVKGLPKLKFIELRQNPMPDEVYDRYDALDGITIVHDGNADDWK